MIFHCMDVVQRAVRQTGAEQARSPGRQPQVPRNRQCWGKECKVGPGPQGDLSSPSMWLGPSQSWLLASRVVDTFRGGTRGLTIASRDLPLNLPFL